MKHSTTAVKITDGEIEFLFCPYEIAPTIVRYFKKAEKPVAPDGWYGVGVVHESHVILLPFDQIPEVVQ